MGLVVLAPADSIFDLPVAGPKSPQGDEKSAGNGSDFAGALLAAFGGMPASELNFDSGLGLGLRLGLAPGPGGDRLRQESDALVVSLVAFRADAMPLQTLAVDLGNPEAATHSEASSAGDAQAQVPASAPSTVEPMEIAICPPVAAASETTSGSPPEPASPLSLPAEAPSEQVPSPAAGPPDGGGPAIALEPAATSPATAAQVPAPIVAARNSITGAPEATNAPAEADPPEQSIGPDSLTVDVAHPPEQGQEESVVRFVGDAEEGQNSGGEEGPRRRGEPRASAQGIAHAAARSAVGALRTGSEEPPPPASSDESAATRIPVASPRALAHASEQSAVVRQVAPPGDPNGNGPDGSHERALPNASATAVAHASADSAVAQLRADAPAPAPAPGEPAPPVARPPAVEQVAVAIFDKAEEGGGEARIRLDPPDLGEVRISVRISGDSVRIEIHAERPEAMQILRQHAADLSGLLSGRGLDLKDVYVGLGGRHAPDTSGEQPAERRRDDTPDSEFASILGIDETAPAGRHNRLRAAYNPDGAMVYRV